MWKRLAFAGVLMLSNASAGPQSTPAQRNTADEMADLEYERRSVGDWIELCRQKMAEVEAGREIIWPGGASDMIEWKFLRTSDVEKELRARYLRRAQSGEAEAYRAQRRSYRLEVERQVKEGVKALVRRSIELSFRLDAAKQEAVNRQTSLVRRIEELRAEELRNAAAPPRGSRPRLTPAEIKANVDSFAEKKEKWERFNCTPPGMGCADQSMRAHGTLVNRATLADDPARAQAIKIWLAPCFDDCLMRKGPHQASCIDRCRAKFDEELRRIDSGGAPRAYEAP